MLDENRDTGACVNCRTRMERFIVRVYPGRWPTVLMVGGVFCCLFLIGALVGIPMLLLGIYMATARETISRCPNCGQYFRVWVEEAGSV